MNNYKGLFTYDVDNHRYISVEQADGIIKDMNYQPKDYEEPKKHYEILAMGAVMEREDAEDEIFRNQGQREIGNYFKTKEEAEKAVEKLKAWKQLKDKGFRFERYLIGGEYGNTITFSDYIELNDETRANLDLLFGGQDDSI